MYTAPFRFSKISPQTFLFLKNAYTISWVLFLGAMSIFLAALFAKIPNPEVFMEVTFLPFVMGAGVMGFIFIPVIVSFLGFRNKQEMTIEGDRILFLDKDTKEVTNQYSVQNIQTVSLYGLPIGKSSSRVYVFLLEESISGLQSFVMTSGTRVVFFKSLFDFEVDLSKNGVNTQGIQKMFAKNKKFGLISFAVFILGSILFWIYRFLF